MMIQTRFFSSKTTSATFDNCSLVVIKPHAVRSGNAGAIINKILDANFEISAIQMFDLVISEAKNFCEVYKGVLENQEYSGMVNELASGSCIAIEVRAQNCVNQLRKLCGPYDIEIAKELRPKTIRAIYGVDNVRNAVHCTDLEDDGFLESQFFFDVLVNGS